MCEEGLKELLDIEDAEDSAETWHKYRCLQWDPNKGIWEKENITNLQIYNAEEWFLQCSQWLVQAP